MAQQPSGEAGPSELQRTARAFRNAAGSRRVVVAHRLYRADCDTPLALFARLLDLSPRAFLLESAEGGEAWGRYSFLGLGSLVEVVGTGEGTTVRYADGTTETHPAGFEPLRGLIEHLRPHGLDGLDERFTGGLVGYVAYDAVRYFERLPDAHPDPSDTLYRFTLPEILCVYDNFRQDLRVLAFASARPETTQAAPRAAESLLARMDTIERQLAADSVPGLNRLVAHEDVGSTDPVPVVSNFSRPDFCRAVEQGKEYILAGDIFQVVLSQRLVARNVTRPPLEIYRRLRRANPSPYLFFIAYEDESLIGASPEVMVRLTGRLAEVRPIAGTRPRGATPDEDAALERDLLADPKEIAEHVMLLDLGRNDLGRVSEIGSVGIRDRMVIERYSKVMHIVSHVTGQLRGGLDWLDLLAATFPAGTLSGAPKIRAMQIIDELERSRRRIYGGAVGYIGFDGNMDLGIAIRTLHRRGEDYVVQAGAGIVADSVPEREYEETLNKARALLTAVGVSPDAQPVYEVD